MIRHSGPTYDKNLTTASRKPTTATTASRQRGAHSCNNVAAMAAATACLALATSASCGANASLLAGNKGSAPGRASAREERPAVLGRRPSSYDWNRIDSVRGGGYCRHRGLGEKATRGCFVLCVTPSSMASSDVSSSGGGRGRRQAGRGRWAGGAVAMGLAADTVRRTRAGAVSSPRPLSGFLQRTEHGVVGGVNGEAGVVSALQCTAGDGDRRSSRGGSKRALFRRMVARVRGVAPPASAAETILLDVQVRKAAC